MQNFKIVIGYMPNVDRLPPEAQRLGFNQRLAFVLESYHRDQVNAFFDSALYEGLVSVVCHVVAADTIRVVVSSRVTHEISAPEELQRLWGEVPRAERDPFPRLLLLRRSSVVALIESEPWAQVGGPEPYHDSYTLAVFTASDLSDLLTKEARAFAERSGAEVAEILQGEPTPTKPSFFETLKNLIGWR